MSLHELRMRKIPLKRMELVYFVIPVAWEAAPFFPHFFLWVFLCTLLFIHVFTWV